MLGSWLAVLVTAGLLQGVVSQAGWHGAEGTENEKMNWSHHSGPQESWAQIATAAQASLQTLSLIQHGKVIAAQPRCLNSADTGNPYFSDQKAREDGCLPPFAEFTAARPRSTQSLTPGVLSLEGRAGKYRLS